MSKQHEMRLDTIYFDYILSGKKIYETRVWDDKRKDIFRNYRPKNLGQTLHEVDYIILAPGISFLKNKSLKKFKKKIITDIDLF